MTITLAKSSYITQLLASSALNPSIQIPPWDIYIPYVLYIPRGYWYSRVLQFGLNVEYALDTILGSINSALSYLEQSIANISIPTFPTFQAILTNILGILGVYVYAGESPMHALIRTIFGWLGIPCKVYGTISDDLGVWLSARIAAVIAPLLPIADTIIGWVAAGFGVYRLPGETWWDAFTRRIREITAPWIQALIPSFDTIADQVLSRFGIYRKPGETRLDAIWRTFWESHPGLWQLVNWWSSYKADVMAYFDDPYKWIYERLERMFERFW